MITGKTQLLGVIGYPVEHSLSPVMHNAAIAHLAADYVYVPFPIHPDDLEWAIAGLAAIGLSGFNITIPHKQTIIPLLSEISPTAEAIGAVNTVWRTAQGWSGTNTDVDGFLAPLPHDRDWQHAVAVVLGNGGAARAVVAGCAQLGCAEVHVVGRHPKKLQIFQASWLKSPCAVNLAVHTWDALSQLLPRCTLLVNTTPVGMHPQLNASPLMASELDALPAGAIAIDGLEMLVQQGAAALQIWLQQPVPVEVMRRSLRQHLGLTEDPQAQPS